ncbi:hypothetical protein [Nostoc sp.]|uniref:hypothetical protein n=1 Tax=Nostoc sp. TaxID=1180 RepID=UPI002FF5D711
MFDFYGVVAVPGLNCTTVFPNVADHSPITTFTSQFRVIFWQKNAYFPDVVRIMDFGSFAYPIHNVFHYAIARESYSQLAPLPAAIHPLAQPVPTRLSSKNAIVVRWSVLEFADQWSAKTFEDSHKSQLPKSSSTPHHDYNQSDRVNSVEKKIVHF